MQLSHARATNVLVGPRFAEGRQDRVRRNVGENGARASGHGNVGVCVCVCRCATRRDILQEIERHIVRDVSTVYGVTITGPPWWGRETGDRAGLKKYNDARDAARAVFPKLTDLALSLLRRHVLDNMAYDSAEGRARIRKFARTIATRAKEQNPRDARLQFA